MTRKFPNIVTIRLSPAGLAELRQAAALEEQTVAEFLRNTARSKARRILRQQGKQKGGNE